jgi:pyruvate,orthophosphate dikinase
MGRDAARPSLGPVTVVQPPSTAALYGITSRRMRYVYNFDEPSDGGRALLGGKGVGLAEMTQLGLPVPAGFTITTEACRDAMARGGEFPDGLEDEVAEHVERLEQRTGKHFGDPHDPLLVSVRSGAAISMPGMMDTILNVGLSDVAVRGLAESTGNARFAYDSYRRLIQMYGETVDGIDPHRFESELQRLKETRGAAQDVDLSADDLAGLVETFKDIYEHDLGQPFPQDAREQLRRAIEAVFASWNTPRAQVYRRAHEIPDDLGTAVNVVQMVFGNKGERSGTGVAFTRDPSTGEPGVVGEFLLNAQGEDVVAGIRTPEPLQRMGDRLPDAYRQFLETAQRLEEHYQDVQDLEFTVEDDRLYLLQTRTAKRTAAAALKSAVDMVGEGLIDREQAVARIDPAQLDQLLHPMIDPTADVEVVATGLNASPGAACGKVVFDANRAEELGRGGESVILVRRETTPDDIHGLIHSQGVLTAHGGMTSHAAVVARGMGKPCVAGCEALTLDPGSGTASLAGHELREGDVITIDGGTGRVMLGEVPLVPPKIDEDFQTILGWADDLRRLRVHANADTPEDAAKARELGAQGIGLCRTEHMFMAEDRLPVMREMIMADSEEGRRAALDRILPMQQADFEGIFEAMAGLPVTIRLLDPPLHEFLPPLEEATDERMRERIRVLHEANPMLGMRGCRVGLIFPEIYEMQVRAIVRASKAVHERTGEAPIVEIMHPLVGFGEELRRLRELTVRTVEEEGEIEYLVGTMIELPRACVRADEIAEHADFFSFGTNDLTQTTLGYSRDDAENKFLARYLEDDVLERNPFEVLDEAGVGDLMRIAVERGRGRKEELKLGICGEHGGEPHSVAFCHRIGLDYVSCSPFRVPLARLAAAQAALAEAGVEAAVAGG